MSDIKSNVINDNKVIKCIMHDDSQTQYIGKFENLRSYILGLI